MYLTALTYSICILLAAGTRSPSDLFTTTRSATSTIPFLMPKTDNGIDCSYCFNPIKCPDHEGIAFYRRCVSEEGWGGLFRAKSVVHQPLLNTSYKQYEGQ